MGKTYEIHTDLDPDTLTEIAAETYRQWLEFALGRQEIGGRVLMHPSGRYAASLSWRKEGSAVVAITADETIAPEAKWIEEGRSGTDMKAIMLGGGNTKIAKDGSRYRVIPIRGNSSTPAFDMSDIVSSNTGEHLPIKTGRLWGKARRSFDPSSKFVTMTDKPGSSAWIIPAMPAYSPAAILAESIREATGSR